MPALDALSSALQGELACEPDWMELLKAANVALVTPNLRHTLLHADATIPEDVATFLTLIDKRNNERNANLRSMAFDAIVALNAAGIEPVLLKGMAVWATCAPHAQHYARMMSDVDLLLGSSDEDAALHTLLNAGFKIYRRDPEGAPHIIAELWRDGGVGMLDLHRRLPGPPAFAAQFDCHAHTTQVSWGGLARLPTTTLQIYLTCVHDMLHDDGFWSGGFDVRHLCDIAALTKTTSSVDWSLFGRLIRSRMSRNALHSQLVAAQRIAGAEIPKTIRQSYVARLHYLRLRVQYAQPGLHLPLVVLGLALEAFNLDRGNAATRYSARLRRILQIRHHPNRI